LENYNQLLERRDEIICQSNFHSMVYYEYYDRKPATVTRRINAHIKMVREKKQELDDFIEQVKTLKKLKELLAQKYDSSMERMLEDFTYL